MPVKEIIQEQVAASGPIPFEEFMRLALYHPDGGYFADGRLRSERAGDFLTSPEVSGLFGEMLARFVAAERNRIGEPFEVVEVGAGSGSLLRSLLGSLDVVARAVEVSPAAREALTGLLPDGRVIDRLPPRVRGVVIANELVDNIPMALAQKAGDVWRERWVGGDGNGLGFVDADVRPEVLAWLESNAGDVPDGGWVEVQLEAQVWLGEALDALESGSVVIFDYGDSAENLIPRRQDGTLRTYRAHHLGPHPLDEPGETDITADVNFTALLATARNSAARVDLQRQDDFLADLGLRDRLSQLRHAELAAARSGDDIERLRLRTLKTEAETLLHPRGLGDFRVLIASK